MRTDSCPPSLRFFKKFSAVLLSLQTLNEIEITITGCQYFHDRFVQKSSYDVKEEIPDRCYTFPRPSQEIVALLTNNWPYMFVGCRAHFLCFLFSSSFVQK